MDVGHIAIPRAVKIEDREKYKQGYHFGIEAASSYCVYKPLEALNHFAEDCESGIDDIAYDLEDPSFLMGAIAGATKDFSRSNL